MGKKKELAPYTVTVDPEEADRLVYRILKEHLKWAKKDDWMTHRERKAFKLVINWFSSNCDGQ